jgi:WD40 repeat protein
MAYRIRSLSKSEVRRHDGTANSAAFFPDGRLLASGGGGAAKVWDLSTNKAS